MSESHYLCANQRDHCATVVERWLETPQTEDWGYNWRKLRSHIHILTEVMRVQKLKSKIQCLFPGWNVAGMFRDLFHSDSPYIQSATVGTCSGGWDGMEWRVEQCGETVARHCRNLCREGNSVVKSVSLDELGSWYNCNINTHLHPKGYNHPSLGMCPYFLTVSLKA